MWNKLIFRKRRSCPYNKQEFEGVVIKCTCKACRTDNIQEQLKIKGANYYFEKSKKHSELNKRLLTERCIEAVTDLIKRASEDGKNKAFTAWKSDDIKKYFENLGYRFFYKKCMDANDYHDFRCLNDIYDNFFYEWMWWEDNPRYFTIISWDIGEDGKVKDLTGEQ